MCMAFHDDGTSSIVRLQIAVRTSRQATAPSVRPAAECGKDDCLLSSWQATALVERLSKVSRGLERRNVVAAEGQASLDVRPSNRLAHCFSYLQQHRATRPAATTGA